MLPTSSHRFDALGGVPGAHLGLAWSDTSPADLDEVVQLCRRCEDVDGVRVRLPVAAIERTMTAAPSMVGRDRTGIVRACAGVRSQVGQVAVRALVDPSWRCRGVGRAMLAWQDRWAREFLAGRSPSTVAVPIAAHLVDRRRLYTAAGFSARARIELHVRRLGDPPVVPLPPAGWTIRPLLPGDVGLTSRAEPDSHGFLATALTLEDLVETCEPSLSLVAELDGAARAAVLVHPASNASGGTVGWCRALLAEAGTDEVLQDLLGAAFHASWKAGLAELYLFTTPTASARWREVLPAIGCEPVDVELLYSIESP